MDTRTKILTPSEARRLEAPLTLVTGYFDVLRAEHVRELQRARDAGFPLLAIVLPLEDALLEQRARAELTAALRMVDYVVAAGAGDAEDLIDALRPASVVRLEPAEARLALQLREHVQERETR